MGRKKPLPEFESNGLCLAYIRVSTGMQVKSGNGLQAQSDRIQREARKLGLTFRQDIHHDTLVPPRPGFFVDPGESAFRTSKFAKRTAGGAVLDWLDAGDTLILSKLDRGWRNVRDFVDTANELTERGIRLVVCDPPINLGTATGRMFANFLAVIAEWESDRKGERIREALATKKLTAENSENIPARHKSKKTVSTPSEWIPSPHNANFEADDSDESNEPVEARNSGKPGKIYIYLRCSHRDSVISGLGLLKQAERCREYAEWLMEQNPNLKLDVDFTDLAISAASVDLRCRPMGKMMDETLKDGDYVVFASLDRGFRNVADLALTCPEWEKRGVHVHFADEGISMDDPAGQFFASVAVQFAAIEAKLTSDRTKEARAIQKSQGTFCGGYDIPVFFKEYELAGNKRMLLIDRRQITAFRLVMFLRHHRKMTVIDACARTEELMAAKEKRPAICATGAVKGSRISAQLPAWYPRGKNGTAYPIVNKSRFDLMWRWKDKALAAWRRYAQGMREARNNERE